MVQNGDASSPFIATNREIEISARGTDSQDDYVDDFATAVAAPTSVLLPHSP